MTATNARSTLAVLLGALLASGTGCLPASRTGGRTALDHDGARTVEEGIASYYGDEFEGRRTASGETYRHDAATAAHRTLPFGTVLRVVNLRNGHQTTVRVNDRGPFRTGRIVDLSRSAARELGLLESGTAPVRIEVVAWNAPPAGAN